jgi:hypothetical protein
MKRMLTSQQKSLPQENKKGRILTLNMIRKDIAIWEGART